MLSFKEDIERQRVHGQQPIRVQTSGPTAADLRDIGRARTIIICVIEQPENIRRGGKWLGWDGEGSSSALVLWQIMAWVVHNGPQQHKVFQGRRVIILLSAVLCSNILAIFTLSSRPQCSLRGCAGRFYISIKEIVFIYYP